MIRAKSLAWIGGVGLLGLTPAMVFAQGLPLPPTAPVNTVPVQVAPPSTEVVQTGGDRSLKPRDILRDGVENHRKFEFELADVYLKKAQELRSTLSAAEQKELDACLQSNSKALAMRKQGQEMIQRASAALNAGKYQEADGLLKQLKTNTYLSAQDRQSVVTLSEVYAKTMSASTMTRPVASQPTVMPKGNTPVDMVVAAREAFKLGKLDEADMWAQSAVSAKFSSRWPWEDTPEKVMNDVKVARAKMAKTGGAGTPEQRQQQAKQLCMQASQALSNGDIATAKRLNQQALSLNAELPWFEEYSPAKVNEAIARAEKSGVRGAVANVPSDPRVAVKEARAALDQGNLDHAEELANAARVSKVSWGLFEDNPEKVLADAKSARQVAGDKQAVELLKMARRQLDAGNFDEAEKLCARSKALKPEYSMMDFSGERPDKMMSEIQQKRAVAKRNNPQASMNETKLAVNVPTATQGMMPPTAVPPAMPNETVANTVPSKPQADPRVAQANRMMAEARMDLNKGQYDAALSKAAAVKAMGVVTADKPENIYAAVQAVKATNDAKMGGSVADAKRMKALQLVASARVMTKTGDIMGAHKAAMDAKSMAVVYQQGDDLPDAVLADLQMKARQQVETYAKAAETLTQRGKAGEAQQYRNYVMNLAMTFNVPAPQMGVAVNVQVPGQLNMPAVTDVASSGKKLCTDIEQCMREGQLVNARKLANALYEGPYGLKVQAGQYLAQLDSADMKASVKATEQYYELVVRATNRKEYDLAKSYAEKIDRKLLDEAKAKHLNEMLSNPAFQQTEKGVIQSASSVSTQDSPGKTSGQSALLDETRKKHEIESQRLNELKNTSIAKAMKFSRDSNFDAALVELKAALETVKKADPDVPNVTTMTRQLEMKVMQYQKLSDQLAFEREAKDKLDSKQLVKQRRVADEENRRTQVAALMTEYKNLMKDGKYADAEARAERAHAIDPDNPAIDAARHSAQIQKVLSEDEKVVKGGRDLWTTSMQDVSRQALVGDEHPLNMPSDFTKTSAKRLKQVADMMKREGRDELPNNSKMMANVSVDFRNKPLCDVVEELRVLSQTNMLLEGFALEYAGIDAKMPISITLNNVPLKTVLNAVLNQAQLTYYLRDGVINITTKDARASHKVKRSFAVHDIIVPRDDMANLPNMMQGTTMPVSTGDFNPMNSQQGNGNGRESYNGTPTSVSSSQWQTRRTGQTLEKQLIHLITSTIEPDSWKGSVNGGTGSIEYYPTGMTLIVSQSSDIQEQIEELIKRLRELQEVQITVEVRILTLTDDFFERMGVDFNVSLPNTNTNFERQVASGNFAPDGLLNYPNHAKGVIVGLTPAGNFTNNLNIPVSNDSYRAARLPTGFAGIGTPGNTGGLDVGVAFLSSIQVFLVMEAVQGDIRNSTLQAPKVTMFNGQVASISSSTTELFVTQVNAVQNFFTGIPVFIPVNTQIPSFTTLTVQAVVTNDRRYVQLTMQPSIQTVVDRSRSFTAVAGITLQQPVISNINVATTVMVPDGGTILVGGLKTMSEQRREFGPPILSKIPYINRLFRNQSYGKSATSLMFMVTPRIIINEEEEEKLGSTWSF